jgi:tRNA-Thr(GGU) m(6)t(6)A37 methyltransferase TsaA
MAGELHRLDAPMPPELVVQPIGFVHSPFVEKAEAPRQATVGSGVAGTIEILPLYRDALSDLEGFERIWVIFWFDRVEPSATGKRWRAKVLPPRSDQKRGVFATRSPHRPNPIGLSAVRLDRVDGLTLHVRDLDLVEGTPVLDIKPYLPYADAFPDASAGWLEARDPRLPWTVTIEPAAEEALAWIASETGLDLRDRVASALRLGPQPHAYRRIKQTPDGQRVLAVKEWRVPFRVDDAARRIIVERIATGYRPSELARGREPVHALHRAFVERFG